MKNAQTEKLEQNISMMTSKEVRSGNNKFKKLTASSCRLIAVLLSLCLLSFVSDDLTKVKSEIMKINQSYTKTKQYSMEVTYNVYNNYSSQKLFEQSKGYFIRSDNNYISDVLGVKTIQNDQYKLIIDSASNIILVAHPDQQFQNASTQVIDAAIKACSSVKYTDDTKIPSFKMFFKDELAEFSLIQIQYAKSDYFMRKLILFHTMEVEIEGLKQRPRTEILYKNIKSSAKVDSETFSEKKYIIDNKGKVQAAKAYMKYKVIDQRVKK
jgi:hypothetical protein